MLVLLVLAPTSSLLYNTLSPVPLQVADRPCLTCSMRIFRAKTFEMTEMYQQQASLAASWFRLSTHQESARLE